MSTISNNNIASAIYLALKDKTPGEQSLIFPKVIHFLAGRHLLSRSQDILLRLDQIINDRDGRVVARISSKNNLNTKTNAELARVLAIRYSAKEVALVENIDAKLLGGFKIEVNDEVIDMTIKNKIEKLQEYLTSKA
jgi:F0F1-type ATP synthase delta subunit